ncbi:MAG: hypothetical protein EOO52_18860 [Gammaproteobacteria bacterium]|nr:MAG: hypothetical protein EOO52_18860 [Gammaproteobacteria bacterium]
MAKIESPRVVMAITTISEKWLGLWGTQKFNTASGVRDIEVVAPNFYAKAFMIRRCSDNVVEALSNTNKYCH